MTAQSLLARDAGWRGHFGRHASGILLSVIVAIASGFIADHRGGPTLLYALLIGMR